MFGIKQSVSLACFGMYAEGRLEQMVEPLGDSNVEPGVGELQHDLVEDVGVGPVARLALELEEREDPLVHGVPPLHRVLVFGHQFGNVLPKPLVRDQGQHLVPPGRVTQNVLVV